MTRSFMRWPGFKLKALTLSYDDGVVFDRRLIEILDKNGIKGTFNINSGLFAPEAGGRRLSRDEAYELYANSGHEVAVHGVYHLPLDRISAPLIVNDVLNDRIALEGMFGRMIQGMAYAFGTYNDEVVEILKKCGIKYARTVEKTEKFDVPTDWLRMPATCHHGHARLMDFAREFVEYTPGASYMSQKPLLFYLWGHSYEFNDKDNWHVIENFCEYMGGREDVWYATNIDVVRYTEAFDALEFSADGSMIYNPTNIDVYVHYFTNDYVIPKGETVKVVPKR